jgi:carbon-monoxide dehydrogenase large subunit/6-hydroxypseudooxynicotine dehydrogenase subunit gamma
MVRAKALDIAAELLQTPADALTIVDGIIKRKDRDAGPSITLEEIAAKQGTQGLSCEGTFRTDHMTYPYGVHIAQLRVDRETGEVTIERFLVAYDVGRAVNPMMIEGQIVGGFAQGLGGALFEEFVYADTGAPLSVTFADYLLPTSCDVSRVDVLLTEDAPSDLNPLGIKGAGEAGVTAVGGAIASAIDNAIGAPFAVTSLPVTPHAVLELVRLNRASR